MSPEEPLDKEAEKMGHRLIKMSDGIWVEVSETDVEADLYLEPPALGNIPLGNIELKPFDMGHGHGSFLRTLDNPLHHQRKVQEAVKRLSVVADAVKGPLGKGGLGRGAMKLFDLPPGEVRKFSLDPEAEEDRSEDSADRQVEEIRSALRESQRLGESSERRLDELRQRRT